MDDLKTPPFAREFEAELDLESLEDCEQIAVSPSQPDPVPPVIMVGRFRREPFDDIRPSFAEGKWLLSGLIPRQGLVLMAGPPGAGKSLVALDWSLCLGAGLPVLGESVTRAGVVYLGAEDAEGIRHRKEAWKATYGRSPGFELVTPGVELPDLADVSGFIDALRSIAGVMAGQGIPLRLLVIDTLAASMSGGDENLGAEMGKVLSNLRRIITEVGVAVLVLTHTGKDYGRGVRGWSGQQADADTVIMFDPLPPGGTGRGTVSKHRNAAAGRSFTFEVEAVAIGHDDKGTVVDAAVVRLSHDPGGRRAVSKVPVDQILLLRVLTELQAELGAGTEDRPLVSRRSVKERFLAETHDPGRSADAQRKAFDRLVEKVIEKGLVEGDTHYLRQCDGG